MPAVTRLVTRADLTGECSDGRTMSVSVRHEAVLADGRRLLLLDDRGWSSMTDYVARDVPEDGLSHEHVPAVRSAARTLEDLEQTARMVVGPDEPSGERSREDKEAAHWSAIADTLKRQGVAIDGSELKGLPHDVVLGERLRDYRSPRP